MNSELRTQNLELSLGFLVPDLSHRHGWARHSLNLLRALRGQGVQMTVIAARNCPPVDGFEVHRLLPSVTPAERYSLLKQLVLAPRVRALLKTCNVIHATIEPYAPLAALVAGNRPLFVTVHGSYVRLPQERRPPASAVYRWSFRRACLVCVSRYTEAVARETLPGARTVVVNNGVDVERFAAIPQIQREKKPLVLTVGAVKARKGTLELVEAMARVKQVVPDAQCSIVGSLEIEPGYVEKVRDAIRRLGLETTVQLTGQLSENDLQRQYEQASVFVVPAINDGRKFEGYGLVYLEASAAGLPVIGTTDSGAEDAIDDGLTGLLIPQQEISERLPEAIIHLLTNPARARQMGAAGRFKAGGQTWEHVARQMLELYRAGC